MDTDNDIEQRTASYWRLFATFFKIGAFTFGGGWAMISIIEREIVDRYHWIDKLRGTSGSVVASLGTILPSFLIILAIAIFLTPEMIKNNRVISAIFMGIRPAVVALIIAPVLTSAKAAKLRWKTVWIPLVVALMISLDLGFVSNPILYILLGAAGGFLFWWLPRIKTSRNDKR